MTIGWFVAVVVGCAASYLWLFRAVRGRARVGSGLLLSVLWLSVAGMTFTYLTGQSVRVYVDTWWHPVGEHVVLSSGSPGLPLPPGTALRFRYADGGASYYSRLSNAEVERFFRQVASVSQAAPDGQGVRFDIAYRGTQYLARITPNGRGVDLRVDR